MATPLVSINGIPLPTPSYYIGTEATLVDSGRNLQGKVVGSVIRNSVAKVEIRWRYLPAATWAEILQLFNPAYGGSFYNSVTFLNQLTNGWTTKEMYVGDRTTSGAFMVDPDTGLITGYTEPKLSLIEV